jgi:tubulin polyglutamylase TTLL9
MKDLVQETYCLYIPEERARFFGQLPTVDSKENLWILKPCASSRGRGIRILWQFDELRDLYAHPERHDFDPQADRFVIQRYIRNPLLLDARKSEMRLYWLIPSVDPLLVLMYREGTVRLNSKPFVLDDFDNTLVHVTNVYQQKSHPGYDPSVVLKWSFSDLERYLVQDLELAPENYIEGHLKPRLKRMLSFVAKAAAPSLVQCPVKGLFFGLFGADVILDDTLHPWLTEVQKGPGLSFDDPIKRKVIPPMLNEAVSIMLEVQRRKRGGLGLENIDAARGFEWVIRQT